MANPANGVPANDAAGRAGVARIDMKLEVVIIPVSDVDRAKEFYGRIGWRLNADRSTGEDFRLVQFTPPGSSCSVHFGKNVTLAAPGSAKAFLVVPDIEHARDQLVAAGVEVGEFFHDGPEGRGSGLHPQHLSYRSRALFNDPDGNAWQLQEVTTRLPGRVEPGAISLGSASDLASALRRAEAAHGEHEKRTGQRDANWPDWYAACTGIAATACHAQSIALAALPVLLVIGQVPPICRHEIRRHRLPRPIRCSRRAFARHRIRSLLKPPCERRRREFVLAG
jgi:catechol 2,3-dioxygenase-like lactoylglutathione lyase family enzyme